MRTPPRISRAARASLHSASDVRARRSTLQPVAPVAAQAAEPETAVDTPEVLREDIDKVGGKMKVLLLVACFVLAAPPGQGRSTPADAEESVVSDYTTPAGGNRTALDVYQQIAYNVASRITSPIYRLFGYGENKTEDARPNKSWSNIEIFDDWVDRSTKPDLKPLGSNALGAGRDVEELSEEAKKKADKKPEKITLYSNYLNGFDNVAAAQNSLPERNDTLNEVSDKDDELSLDDISVEDDKDSKPREGGFVYFLELIGSWFQLIYGGLSSIFNFRS